MIQEFCKFFWSRRRHWIYTLLSILTALSIIFVYQMPSYGNRWVDIFIQGIQIIQISRLSDADEVKFGEEINQSLLASEKVELNENNQINRYIDRIGQKLAVQSDRSNIPYTFQVVQDESINAFATMGGYVYVNTGLMLEAENEAELASVMAHEIGHIVGRHALEQLRQQAIAQGVITATGLDESTAVQLGIEVALNLPRSREDEREADQLGLINLERAGYAPIAMITFMEKLLQYSNSAPSILSTHPATSERIVTLQQTIDPKTANQGDGLDTKAYQQKIRSLF